MAGTYRAIQVTASGRLDLVDRPVPAPEPGEVLIAVEACGLCGADRGDIENADTASRRAPGHEVVGRIVALGVQVPAIWQLGQRVGIGRFCGPYGICGECRRGKLHLYRQQPVTGSSRDGVYAEMMTARASGLVAIPDALSSAEAAPLLCAGIATFNGLRAAGAEPGDTVAILGIGGLGHMAIQYARRKGFRTIAMGRGTDIADAARALGAHLYVDAASEDAVAVLKRHGGSAAILSTIGDTATVSALMPGLAPEGRLVLLGIGKDPLAVQTAPLVSGARAVIGSITGSPFESERLLDFSVLTEARPRIETLSLERAAEA